MKTICLLQGSFSPQMNYLAKELSKAGCTVYKINFCAGDLLFSFPNHKGVIYREFRGKQEEFESFFSGFLAMERIELVVGHGDSHFYHKKAKEICEKRNTPIWFTEEGYVRPNFITFEEGGVNANSQLMDKPWENDYIESSDREVNPEVNAHFFQRALFCTLYYLSNEIDPFSFPFYKHRREHGLLYEAYAWIKTGFIKLFYNNYDSQVYEYLTTECKNKYFLIPLQVKCDSQITEHSDYECVDDFIIEVIESFSKNADPEDCLLFKHHPYCIGFSDYTKLIAEHAKINNISDRVHYIRGQHLPTLLQNTKGVVTVNSTVGLNSINHGAPTLIKGRAFFNTTPITNDCTLDEFWKSPQKPCHEYYKKMAIYMKRKTQLNGSLYSHFSHTAKLMTERLLK